MKWTTEKPKFNKECLVITGVVINGIAEYRVWQIKKLNGEDGWYWGWLDGYGEEYGDLADLTADYYCILPMIKL